MRQFDGEQKAKAVETPLSKDFALSPTLPSCDRPRVRANRVNPERRSRLIPSLIFVRSVHDKGILPPTNFFITLADVVCKKVAHARG
jgi:hypothetical protein